MYTEYHSREGLDEDRQDQAIGRIIRLLSSLTVKELDALTDKLGQSVRWSGESLGSPGRASHAADGDRQALHTQAMSANELAIDIVGH